MPVYLAIDSEAPSLDALAPAVAALQRGGVIAYPTETFYGLGADPLSAAAVARVFGVKARVEGQSLPLIAADLAQARRVADVTGAAARLAARFWPGPLTLVVPALAPFAEGAQRLGTVAIRVPDHAVARALAAAFGSPITSTSANLSGEPPASVVSELGGIAPRLDVVVDGGRTPGGLPSTIVDVTGGAPTLVRAGAIAWDRVLESLE